jgi:hypothetical protein
MKQSAKIGKLERALKLSSQGTWVKRTNPQLGAFVQAPRADPSHPYDIEVLGDDETLYPTKDGDMDFIVLAHNMMPELIRAAKLFERLAEHLDFVGWGDTYERECSKDLRSDTDKLMKELSK